MKQVNMLEAKTDLSRLVRLLETGQEECIYLSRNNGVPIVRMTLVPRAAAERFGTAEGAYPVTDEEFDAWDEEIADLFHSSQL